MLDRQTLKKYANEQGKLDCAQVFKAAAEMKVPLKQFVKACNERGIRFDNCELGLFGQSKEEISRFTAKNHDQFIRTFSGQPLISCQEALSFARKTDLHPMEVTANANTSGIKIKECKLGCF